MERAKNLINDSYYHHAIFEMYTVLISALRRKLENKGYRISEQRFDQLNTAAITEGLISTDESNFIKILRNQRNQVAHSLHADFDVSDATQTLVKVNQILQRI